MVKVKICGITNLEDARASVENRCDALGFVFYRKSPRYIGPEEASRIIKRLPRRIVKIGVFVNAREETVKRIAKLCRLDILQFHGNESPQFCRRFNRYRIIKAFRVNKKIDAGHILRYKTFAYLFDTFVKSKIGGTGKSFNWGMMKCINAIKQPIFLSGGLSVKNVKTAIREACPDWLDVSSSLEIKPGKKNHRKIREFMKRVRKLQGRIIKRGSYVTG